MWMLHITTLVFPWKYVQSLNYLFLLSSKAALLIMSRVLIISFTWGKQIIWLIGITSDKFAFIGSSLYIVLFLSNLKNYYSFLNSYLYCLVFKDIIMISLSFFFLFRSEGKLSTLIYSTGGFRLLVIYI